MNKQSNTNDEEDVIMNPLHSSNDTTSYTKDRSWSWSRPVMTKMIITSVFVNAIVLFFLLRDTKQNTPAVLPPVTSVPVSFTNPQCMSFNNNLDDELKSIKQVMMMVLPKAAGTTLEQFSLGCSAFSSSAPTLSSSTGSAEVDIRDFMDDIGRFTPALLFGNKSSNTKFDPNEISLEGRVNLMKSYFDGDSTYQFPQIRSIHVQSKNEVIKTIKSATDETLLIYVHRHETERILSAIKHICWAMCIGDDLDLGRKQDLAIEFKERMHFKENGDCVLEESVLHDIISESREEIGGYKEEKPMSCSTMDAIDEYKPKMMIVDFKQANELQQALAKNFCPDLIKQNIVPIQLNVAERKKLKVFVQLPNHAFKNSNQEQQEVLLSDWVEKKKHGLAYTYENLYEGFTCYGKTRDMEKNLHQCDDEVIKINK